MFKQIKLRHLTFVMFFGIFVAALAFSAGCGHRVGRALNDVQELEHEVDKRNEELKKLSNPD